MERRQISPEKLFALAEKLMQCEETLLEMSHAIRAASEDALDDDSGCGTLLWRLRMEIHEGMERIAEEAKGFGERGELLQQVAQEYREAECADVSIMDALE